ncbi:hypothetical protein EJB05_31731, partial [Eragrostis curvula]
MHPAVLLLLLRLSSVLQVYSAAATTNVTGSNARCSPARCGDLNITYPFTLGGVQPLECGFPAFELTCDAGRAYLTRSFRERLYRVYSISYDTNSLAVAVETTFSGDVTCPVPDFNMSSGLALFPLNISQSNKDLVFVYNCLVPAHKLLSPPCANHTIGAYMREAGGNPPQWVPKNCSSVCVPVRATVQKEAAHDYQRLIGEGFLLEWPELGDCDACKRRGGECRFVELAFRCICRDGRPCPTSREMQQLYQVVTHKSQRSSGDQNWSRNRSSSSVSDHTGCRLSCHAAQAKEEETVHVTGRPYPGGTPLASLRKEFSITGSPRTHIFTYEELDEATDGFSDDRELGVGGFGTRGGGEAAVQEQPQGVEQFLNEVDILSRLRHPNLVTLYGCTSQSTSSRDLLLVYEFVPNGTLADHLHGTRPHQAQLQAPFLPWRTRLGVAVETAAALDHLHSVEPQVVHRDVKTNNILLDEAFHVKVADFGLSRLFPADATHVSTAPQGTPGYVDPMYHQCYQLTDKSDVYSFGVVLVELISSRPAVDMARAGASDVNLANMAVHMIQCYEIDRLVDPRLGYRTDAETKRTIDLVAEAAFRCLQPEQDVRPSIREVLDVLREAQRMEQARCVSVDDAGSLKKNRDGSPDSVMYQWISPSTTANNSS